MPEAPPPHRRILPHLAVSEQGLRELEIWLRSRMQPVNGFLHWGTNVDTGNRGWEMFGQGNGWTLDTEGGGWENLTGGGGYSTNTEGGGHSTSTEGGGYDVATGGGGVLLDSSGDTNGNIQLDADVSRITLDGSSGNISLQSFIDGLILLDTDGGDINQNTNGGGWETDTSGGDAHFSAVDNFTVGASQAKFQLGDAQFYLGTAGDTFTIFDSDNDPIVTYTG